jgi:hypothetical protein
MKDVDKAWAERFSPENSLPHLFGPNVTGSIDTFPVVIRRPRRRIMSRLVYAGKYRRCVVKVSSPRLPAAVCLLIAHPAPPGGMRSLRETFLRLWPSHTEARLFLVRCQATSPESCEEREDARGSRVHPVQLLLCVDALVSDSCEL